MEFKLEIALLWRKMQGFSSNFQKRWESKFAFLVTYLIKKSMLPSNRIFIQVIVFHD